MPMHIDAVNAGLSSVRAHDQAASPHTPPTGVYVYWPRGGNPRPIIEAVLSVVSDMVGDDLRLHDAHESDPDPDQA